MSYENLGYDQLAFKASHNSYQRDEDLLEQLQWNDDRRYDCGCRGLELDITRHSDDSGGASETYFQVSHDQGGEGRTLASYLDDLESFHAADQAHDPIFVTLDIKSEEGSKEKFPGEIDTYLRTWFVESWICAPGDVMTGGKDLAASVMEEAW